jgi:mono/diheme cytochrome c family protein
MTTPKKNPISTFLWSFVTLLFLFIVAWMLLKMGTDQGKHKDMGHDYVPPSPLDLTDYSPTKGTMQPGLDLTLAMQGDPATMPWAEAEFQRICAACHGTTGRGDGPAGLALGARDFSISKDWKNGHSPLGIYKTLSEGLAPMMPAYDTYSPAQRFALSKVVADWGRFAHDKNDPASIEAFDQLHSLSAGIKEPNLISVSAAMQAMLKDSDTQPFDLSSLNAIEKALLEAHVQNPTRALLSLTRLDGWQEDLNLFVQAALAGSPTNGFQPSLASLNAESLMVLREIFLRQ